MVEDYKLTYTSIVQRIFHSAEKWRVCGRILLYLTLNIFLKPAYNYNIFLKFDLKWRNLREYHLTSIHKENELFFECFCSVWINTIVRSYDMLWKFFDPERNENSCGIPKSLKISFIGMWGWVAILNWISLYWWMF